MNVPKQKRFYTVKKFTSCGLIGCKILLNETIRFYFDMKNFKNFGRFDVFNGGQS